jgi:hypothetical protein
MIIGWRCIELNQVRADMVSDPPDSCSSGPHLSPVSRTGVELLSEAPNRVVVVATALVTNPPRLD